MSTGDWCVRRAGLPSFLEWGECLWWLTSASKPKVCCSRVCHQRHWAFPGLSAQVSSAPHVFIAVVTFKQDVLSVSWNDIILMDACGDRSAAIFLLVVGWLFSHYFQLSSLGLALYYLNFLSPCLLTLTYLFNCLPCSPEKCSWKKFSCANMLSNSVSPGYRDFSIYIKFLLSGWI